MADTTTIIGIDCAVEDKNIGVAVGEWSAGEVVLTALPSKEELLPVSNYVSRIISCTKRLLLAVDAPLGWPENLSISLASHKAGRPLGTAADLLFRRETDRFVRKCLSKQPLDVGADRIARTAHAALNLLDKIRKLSGREIPLAWEPAFTNSVAAIEVYPAGTLVSSRLPSSGYKKREQLEIRQAILTRLRQEITFAVDISSAEHNHNVLDAILCVLAGCDFLSGKAYPPEDASTAMKEGWIWIRKTS